MNLNMLGQFVQPAKGATAFGETVMRVSMLFSRVLCTAYATVTSDDVIPAWLTEPRLEMLGFMPFPIVARLARFSALRADQTHHIRCVDDPWLNDVDWIQPHWPRHESWNRANGLGCRWLRRI